MHGARVLLRGSSDRRKPSNLTKHPSVPMMQTCVQYQGTISKVSSKELTLSSIQPETYYSNEKIMLQDCTQPNNSAEHWELSALPWNGSGKMAFF